MLPFLKPKHQTGVLVTQHRSDGTKSELPDSDDSCEAGLISCAHDLIQAVHAKDSRAVAAALKAAFEICESQPHDEGSSSNDYDSMNALAARNERE